MSPAEVSVDELWRRITNAKGFFNGLRFMESGKRLWEAILAMAAIDDEGGSGLARVAPPKILTGRA